MTIAKTLRGMFDPGGRPAGSLPRSAAVAIALGVVLACSAWSAAASAAPELEVTYVGPDYVRPLDRANLFFVIENVGDEPAGGPLTLTDTLPDGLTVHPGVAAGINDGWDCGGGTVVTCTQNDQGTHEGAYPLVPGGFEIVSVLTNVDVDAAGPLVNSAEFSGGGAQTVTVEKALHAVNPLPGQELMEWSGGLLGADGSPFHQAGGRPWAVTTTIKAGAGSTSQALGSGIRALEHFKDVHVDLPPGFVGDPSATPAKCTPEELSRDDDTVGSGGDVEVSNCPVASQVGVIRIFPHFFTPVFNVEPPSGSPAAFGFMVQGVPVLLTASLRDESDYGVAVDSFATSTSIPLVGAKVTFWGVPADPSHDGERKGCTAPAQHGPSGRLCPISAPRSAFLRTPTSCTGPLEFSLRMNSWQHPADFLTSSFETPSMTGCELVPFDPELSVEPTTAVPDSPTGLRVELTVPQDQNPNGLAQADLQKAQVTLPEGMTINPASVDGLEACSDAQLDLGSGEPSSCPSASKIGSVVLDTPLLEEPLSGAVYVRSQASGDPASGDLFRLVVELRDDERGVSVKLPGSVVADPHSGRLTTTFDDNPQLPFSKFTLSFKGGPRAPLATPPTCGTKTVTSKMTGWNGKVETPSDSFTVDCPGMSGFSPSFEAGALSPTGGAFSPFVVRIDRRDREEYLDGVSVEMPRGLLAKLKGVPLCGEAAAAAGACLPGSRVGTASVGAGAGSNPFYLDGPVYLTGPYKGAPYGLSVAVPVVAGPYDLGTVVVRQALLVDRDDARVTVVSDPLPRVVKGVPVRLRSIDVNVDRPGFTVNPTSCSEKQVVATLRSQQGTSRRVSSRFQVGDCRALAFRPKLAMRLTGKRQRRTGGHPGVRALVRQGSGQAGISRVEVRLPSSLALDTKRAASDSLCEWRESLEDEPGCPASSVIGHAKAVSPLLNEPLRGPVYFAKRKRINRFGREISTFPSLVIALRGEVAINLRGSTTVKPGALTTTFAQVPDAPISRFELNLAGAKKGILLVTRTNRGRRINLCSKRQIVEADIDGQNGRRADRRIAIKTPCAKASQRRTRR